MLGFYGCSCVSSADLLPAGRASMTSYLHWVQVLMKLTLPETETLPSTSAAPPLQPETEVWEPGPMCFMQVTPALQTPK